MANMEDTALTLNTALTPNDVCVLVTAELGLDWSVRFNENPTIGTLKFWLNVLGEALGYLSLLMSYQLVHAIPLSGKLKLG